MSRLSFGVAVLVSSFPSSALAHFYLVEPNNMYVQDTTYGDPQKAPPCGATGSSVLSDAGVPTFAPGDQVTVTIDEKIFHPGWYRISLGETGPNSLPPEPAYDGGMGYACYTADIENPAVYPVLADDVFHHTAAFSGPQTTTVTLPSNVTCTNCTLQVLEFMSDHGLNNPGGCFYHHCATLNIVAPDAGGTGGGAGGGGGTGTGGGSATGGGSGSTGGGSGSTGGGAAAGGGSGSTGGGSATGGGAAAGGGSAVGGGSATGGSSGSTGGGTNATGGGGSSTGGCSCDSYGALFPLAVLALVTIRRRKATR